MGNAAVRPGDLILADESGVCVIDPREPVAVPQQALAIQAAEVGILASLKAGETLE